MVRWLLAPVRALASRQSRMARRCLTVAGLAAVTAPAAALVMSDSPAAAAPACNLNATTSTFASAVSAAAPGQTVCLASGNYGTWSGTNKAITVAAAPGASPQMTIAFGSGSSGFTLEGMTGMGGTVNAGASNITIQGNVFASELDLEGAETNVVVNANNFTYPVQSTASGPNAKIFLDTTGASPGSAATIENNDIENGDLDGVHIGDGSGDLILGNTFKNLCDRGVNHTDNIQFEAGTQITVAGNYVYEPQNCPTQGITSYDGDTNGLLIEDNVVDVPRDWGIELYSDTNSVVVHNTVVWHPKSYSEFNSGTGQIDIDRKSQDPAGSGTHVYDNVANVDFANGSTGTADHNTDPSTVSYIGGTPSPSSVYSNLFLTSSSPGHNAAGDGSDTGIQHTVP
jgi:Right handed beta helix region